MHVRISLLCTQVHCNILIFSIASQIYILLINEQYIFLNMYIVFYKATNKLSVLCSLVLVLHFLNQRRENWFSSKKKNEEKMIK